MSQGSESEKDEAEGGGSLWPQQSWRQEQGRQGTGSSQWCLISIFMFMPTLMNMLITQGRGRWGVVSPLSGRGRPKIPTPSPSGNGTPSRGAGPPVPRVSSSLLAARQSLHTLPLSGNPSCSGSGDGTGEGCPWDARTHAEG